MNAIKLRNILIVCVVLALGAIGALIYFASNYLDAATTETLHAEIDAELIDQEIDELKVLEKSLEANKASVDKAAQIVSDSKQYQYQDQIVGDINAYAAATGVKVIGYDFGSATTGGAVSANSSLPQVSGVKSMPVTLTLASPMQFDNYLRFVKSIEQNLTKMQVGGINISPDPKSIGNIINPTVVVIVYVK